MSDGASTPMPFEHPARPEGEPASPDGPEVRLCVSALPANVALARQGLAGLADSLGVNPTLVADMKIVLTEACTNAVVHAYGEAEGPLEVTMAVEQRRLILSVSDRGQGLRPLPSAGEGPPLGFGLALIASLADEFGIAGGRHGTTVRIAFALDGADTASPLVVSHEADRPWSEEDVALTLAAGDHAAPVLGRVVSLVAARADFSIDRLSDAQIVSDTIAATAAAHALDGSLRVEIDEHEAGFDLVIGPLTAGGARQLIRDTELPGLGCMLERLTDGLEIEPAGEGERLRARIDVRG